MNDLKKLIKNPLIALIIAALIGGFFGSYFTYRLNNLSIEKRNKEITKQLMLFIHNEIYENYTVKLGDYSYNRYLLDVEGLELINLRAGNLTIKDKQLSFLIRMYTHFSILNCKMNEFKEAQSDPGLRDVASKDIHKWWYFCKDEIKEYEEKFCKDKSLKSEIEVE